MGGVLQGVPRLEAQEEQPTEGPISPWMQEEVRKAIGKVKLGKVLGNCGVNWLTQFLNRVMIEGEMPDDCRDCIIFPVLKQKENASECSNCREIKLI
ncbi:unnamed protein product [Heligmosomoides polygyrus]|uniref:Gag protein n=1 Tax=Heligmosomoides polygyrus TaxID=6339 RepID=A0A183GLA7_HELPZ|nr:unnamed protein product [Heligmosomoides polygyrus]